MNAVVEGPIPARPDAGSGRLDHGVGLLIALRDLVCRKRGVAGPQDGDDRGRGDEAEAVGGVRGRGAVAEDRVLDVLGVARRVDARLDADIHRPGGGRRPLRLAARGTKRIAFLAISGNSRLSRDSYFRVVFNQLSYVAS